MHTPLQKCFVIMPFSEAPADSPAYQRGVKAAVESLGMGCFRVDEMEFCGSIMEQTKRSLERAYFIIADVTAARPNCYYEIGYAHGLGREREVILIRHRGDELHFDIRGLTVLDYESPDELRAKLTRRIVGAILTARSERPADPTDKHRGHFGGCAVDPACTRLLTASFGEWRQEKKSQPPITDLRLEVVKLPGAPPLTGPVRFHVHPGLVFGWPTPVDVVPVNGVAVHVLPKLESAFTVGAEADGGATRLELDLRSLPGAPPSFYE